MYVHIKALGLGLMRPRTIMSILGVKLYIGNMRADQGVSDMIQANEQFSQVESGRGCHVMEIKLEERFWMKTWINRVAEKFKYQNIRICNKMEYTNKITSNCTVMDMAVRYVRLMKKRANI